MDTITSDIKVTKIDISNDYTHVASNRLMIHEPGFSEYTVETLTRYGYMNVFKNDNMIGFSIQQYGEYGQYEINLLHHVINSETVVYDIGSNIGFHSLGLAQHAKKLYAFEPNIKNYKLCKMNTATQPKITVFNVACSNYNGTGVIEDIDLSKQNNYGEVHVGSGSQTVEFVKLDDFIKQHKLLDPQVIKIDVEGHEWEVLSGLDQTIRNTLPVILYEHQHGDYLPEIYDYLTNLGYTIYWFPSANYNVNNYKQNSNNYFMPNSGVINAFAVPFHMDIKTNLPIKAHRNESYAEAFDKLMKAHEQKD